MGTPCQMECELLQWNTSLWWNRLKVIRLGKLISVSSKVQCFTYCHIEMVFKGIRKYLVVMNILSATEDMMKMNFVSQCYIIPATFGRFSQVSTRRTRDIRLFGQILKVVWDGQLILVWKWDRYDFIRKSQLFCQSISSSIYIMKKIRHPFTPFWGDLLIWKSRPSVASLVVWKQHNIASQVFYCLLVGYR